jgi:hypothetical protein
MTGKNFPGQSNGPTSMTRRRPFYRQSERPARASGTPPGRDIYHRTPPAAPWRNGSDSVAEQHRRPSKVLPLKLSYPDQRPTGGSDPMAQDIRFVGSGRRRALPPFVLTDGPRPRATRRRFAVAGRWRDSRRAGWLAVHNNGCAGVRGGDRRQLVPVPGGPAGGDGGQFLAAQRGPRVPCPGAGRAVLLQDPLPAQQAGRRRLLQ